MGKYSSEEKSKIIRELLRLQGEFGAAPLSNINTNGLVPDDIDVVAVGSLLYRKDNSVVLVRRKETPMEWIIPGGTVDSGESLVSSVTREVKEETGLDSRIDGLLRVGLAMNYSPAEFRAVNLQRYGKEAINLFFVNFRGVEIGGELDCSKDPSENILEVKAFHQVPFQEITYVYRVLFVQEGLYSANLANYPPVAFQPPIENR